MLPRALKRKPWQRLPRQHSGLQLSDTDSLRQAGLAEQATEVVLRATDSEAAFIQLWPAISVGLKVTRRNKWRQRSPLGGFLEQRTLVALGVETCKALTLT